MNYIKGKIRSYIFESESGFKVGLFRVKETNDAEVMDFLNKTLTFTGIFAETNTEDTYIFYGEFIYNDKYGYQYKVNSYEREEPKGFEATVEFLSSSLIKGCGEKTAFKIVETLGEDALSKIKENYQNLLLVPGINESKAKKIYDSIVKYQSTDEIILKLKTLGFTIKEALNILNVCSENTQKYIDEDMYKFCEVVEFNKVDNIYLTIGQIDSEIRVKACIVESLKRLSFMTGSTYFSLEVLDDFLKREFKIFLNTDKLNEYIYFLVIENKLKVKGDNIYLKDYYDYENLIAKDLMGINKLPKTKVTNFEEIISDFEKRNNVLYNKEQKNAIKEALENRVTIITGGPGTGKTTIVNAIVKLYIEINRLSGIDILNDIALLSPTGRASKKLAESTCLPSMTIHRYLKWNKEKNEFQVNEYNKNAHKLIVVDEMSMIDTFLFSSLLQGLNQNIKLVIVGDTNQLPSVGPGLVLADIIDSQLFKHCPLEKIYRQSDNSYIPILAKEIRENNLSSDFLTQKDDYNFLNVKSDNIKEMIRKICQMSMVKNIDEKSIQILAPMYKGPNGIDNLNIILQDLFNPKDKSKKELKLGDVIYREGDKVLQLVNDPDNNVFNGDIGYIKKIETKLGVKKKDIFTIDFDGNRIEYEREDMISVKHAYAISIHKSQGSEFPHVILPICKGYYKMLYNKLIYTGVSRAKKSLVVIGEPDCFVMAINNDYSSDRKTTLKEFILNK